MRVPLGRDRRRRDGDRPFRQAVHHHRAHPERRWYPIEIEAPSRASFTEWETRLDAVLDAYFEDGAASEDDTAEDTAVKETAARDEAAKDDADKDTAAGKDTADEPSADDA